MTGISSSFSYGVLLVVKATVTLVLIVDKIGKVRFTIPLVR